MSEKKPSADKVVVTARIEKDDIDALDELAARSGTFHFKRSRSELVGFAIREYVEKHGAKGRGQK